MLVALEGTCLGELKVKREVRLIDLYGQLMAALGGAHCSEPQLVDPAGKAFDDPRTRPFLNASDFDMYTLLRAPLADPRYVNRAEA